MGVIRTWMVEMRPTNTAYIAIFTGFALDQLHIVHIAAIVTVSLGVLLVLNFIAKFRCCVKQSLLSCLTILFGLKNVV